MRKRRYGLRQCQGNRDRWAGDSSRITCLCRSYRGQTKGKAERTVQFVIDNFMVGIKYNSLPDLNGQALAWCNKVNGKVHATASAQSALNFVSAWGENSVRSLAPPFKIAPASLGCDFVFCALKNQPGTQPSIIPVKPRHMRKPKQSLKH